MVEDRRLGLLFRWINNHQIKDEINGWDDVAGGTTNYMFLTVLIYEDQSCWYRRTKYVMGTTCIRPPEATIATKGRTWHVGYSIWNERVFWVLVNSKRQRKPKDQVSEKQAKGHGYQEYITENKESLWVGKNCNKQRKSKVWEKWKKQEDRSKS